MGTLRHTRTLRRARPSLSRGPAVAALAAATVTLLLACHRPAPPAAAQPLPPALQSLRSPEYAPRFGLAYWTGRLDARGADPTWDRALLFCRQADPDRHPNCRTVRLLETASRIPGFAHPDRPEETTP